MNNITKSLAYLLIMSLILTAGGYYYHLSEDKDNNSSNTPTTIVNEEEEFTSNVKLLYNKVQTQWISDSMLSEDDLTYCNVDGCIKGVDEVPSGYLYNATVNKAGLFVKFFVTNGVYQFTYIGEGLKQEDITTASKISDIDPNEVVTILPSM
ncbi:MAG: hypothetical protein J6X02_03510 [Bacilli bacterium]|nr:hypothetical protein [Bacilli bacterium]